MTCMVREIYDVMKGKEILISYLWLCGWGKMCYLFFFLMPLVYIPGGALA